MKNYTFLILSFCLLGFEGIETVYSQGISDYTFTQSTATYSEISGTNVTLYGDANNGYSANLLIGFNFYYCGSSYITFGCSSNGWLNPGATGLTDGWGSLPANTLSSATYNQMIAPLWDDLSTNDLEYLLTGTAPYRVLTVQWKNVYWNKNNSSSNFNFQVKLYETTNTIKICYGSATGTPASASASVGLSDQTGGSGHFISLTPGSPATTSMTSENSTIAAWPGNGTVYTFSLPLTSMYYISSTCSQPITDPVLTNSANNGILLADIVTAGTYNPLTVSAFYFNVFGTTNPSVDISSAKLYYTGSSSVLSTSNLIYTFNNPQGNMIMSLPTAVTLGSGDNYFWLTFDISGSATSGDVVDANFQTVTVGGTPYNPTVQNPAGNRTIVTYPCGNYTINASLPASSTNFQTFTAAVSFLGSTSGLSCPVVFNVAPGTYYEHFTMPAVTGTSAVNTITFQAANGDSTSVILEYPTSLYVINMNGAAYTVFRNMTIMADPISAYSKLVTFTGNAHDNVFQNDCFTGKVNTTGGPDYALIYSDGSYNNNNNSFLNNIFENGSMAFFWQGIPGNCQTGTVISNNKIENQYSEGIRVNSEGNLTISGNTITGNTTSSSYYAVDLEGCAGGCHIAANKIFLTAAGSNSVGISELSCSANSGNENYIDNNMIISTANLIPSYGIYISSSPNQRIVYNTIKSTGAVSSSNILINTTTPTNIVLMDNVLVYTGQYGEFLISNNSNDLISNYNDFYTTGQFVAYWGSNIYYTVADYKSATGRDLNSININPVFVSPTDLHTFDPALNGHGTPVTGVTVDIDGQPRNPVTPDPGADEFDVVTVIQVNGTVTNVNCYGASTGAISLTLSGGTTPYSFSWGSGVTSQNRTGLAAGSYSVTVSDAASNSTVSVFTVTQPAQLTVTGTVSNVTGSGGSDGSILISVSGGTPSYTYHWSNQASTANISSLAAGTYSLTVTDQSSCQLTASFNVAQPGSLQVQGVITNDQCNGICNGSVAVTVTGGITPYTCSWNNGATTQNLSGLCPGSYSVTVNDAGGSVTQPFGWTYTVTSSNHTILIQTGVVTLNSNPVSNGDYIGAFYSVSGVLYCGGYIQWQGTVTSVAAWATDPMSQVKNGFDNNELMNWKVWHATGGINGAEVNMTAVYNTSFPNQGYFAAGGMSVLTNLSGTYSTNGTSHGYYSATVTQPGVLSPVVNVAGNNISLTVSGGTSPYTCHWSNGSSSFQLTGLTSGTYYVTATDNNGCTATSSGTVTQSVLLNITGTIINVSNYGGSNGSVSISVTGGTTPYTYHWSNQAATSTISNLAAGSYIVTVTDQASNTGTASFTVSQPPYSGNLQVQGVIANDLCYGNCNGTVSLSVSGGSSPYSFVWSNAATTQNISNLCAGIYTVTVSDASGSQAQPFNWNYTITSANHTILLQTGIITINGNNIANGDYVGVFYTYNGSLYCGGYTQWTGLLNSVAAWGNDPLSSVKNGFDNNEAFTWKAWHATSGSNGAVLGMTAVYNTGFPNQGAFVAGGLSGLLSLTGTYSASGSAQVYYTATITQPSVLTATASVSGNNISLTVTGGTTPYVYSWSNGATTQNLSGVSAGTYTVTVTDSKLCTATASGTLSQSGQLSVNGTITNASCYGSANGSVSLSVSGGTTPYSFAWSNSATNQNLSNLSAGTYSVTVSDASGSTGQPFNWDYTITSANHIILLETGVITLNGNPISTGDYAGVFYTYNGNLYCGGYAQWTGSLNSVTAWGNDPLSSVKNGFDNNEIFTWKVWHSSGGSNGVIVNMTPVYNTSFPSQGNYVANGLSVLLSLSGTYASSGGLQATYSATVTQPSLLVPVINVSGSNLNLTVTGGTTPYTYYWSNGSTNQNLSNVANGTYFITVTDSHSCTATASGTVSQGSQLSISGTVINVNCYGAATGAISITVSGGTTPYSFNWGSGITNQNRTGLVAGAYSVTVTDALSMNSISGFTVTQPAAALSASTTGTNDGCYGASNGSVNLTVSGGTTPYTFYWSNGVTTQNLSALAAGTYTVTVIDNKSCTSTASRTITQPNLLSVGGTVTDVNCFGGSTGAVNITVTGGTTGYSYNWGSGVTSQNRSGLATGTYAVTVTDANSCTASSSYSVTQPASALSVSATGNNATCYGSANGSANLTVSGGTSPYVYNWSNGATTQNLSGLYAGTYSVTVTDNKSCTASASKTVSQPAQIIVNGSPININCFGGATGAINLSVSGGTTAYQYNWGSGVTSQNRSGLTAGSYSVTVTDANSCSASLSFSLTQPASALSVTPTAVNVSCNGLTNGSVSLVASGGTSPYIFNWSNGATNQNLTGLATGTYSVTVTDNKSCTASASATINQPMPLNITGNAVNVNCFGALTGSVSLTVSGGTTAYSFNWGSGVTTQNRNGLAAGTYQVTVTDANNCSSTSSFSVTQPASALSATTTPVNVTCYGLSNGSVSLIASGGTSPYTFNWSNLSTTENISGLAAGTYTVTVTDNKSCTVTSSKSITQPVQMNISGTVTNAGCYGGSSGAINLAITGGTTSYSFNWGSGVTSQNRTGLSAGTYQVTVTDANSCSASSSFTVTQNTAISLTTTVTNAISGSNNGSVNLTVSGGSSPYTCYWSNGATTQNITNLAAGSYCVTVTDQNQCTSTACGTVQSTCVMPWSYIVTGVNHSIMIFSGTVTINGNPIAIGDYIGVFYNVSGTLVCGGYIQWAGVNTSISAWGDDSSTPQKDGFASGETFNWKIWQASTCQIFDVNATYSSSFPDQSNYNTNGMSGLTSLSTMVCQSIIVSNGWCMYSTYVSPANSNIANIFALDNATLIIAKDENGGVYWPQYGVNQIGNIVIGHGYLMKISGTDTVSVCGQPIAVSTPISLQNGWSIIGYLKTTCGNITTMLSSISSNIMIAKDCNGGVYWPLYGVNQILNLCPGRGYLIKLAGAATLIYPAGSNFEDKAMNNAGQQGCNCQSKNTGNNMTLGISGQFTENGNPVMKDYEIKVFDSFGTLVGSGLLNEGFTALTLWGDDETTPEKEGLVPGESFRLVLVNRKTGEMIPAEVEDWQEGDGRYSVNGISIAGNLVPAAEGTQQVELFQNMPNPYKETTEIGYYLPVKMDVTMNLFNLTGDRIRNLVSGKQDAGYHNIEFSSEGLLPGIYFYRLETPYGIELKKMTLLK